MNEVERAAKLAGLKARIPNVKCKGHCWRACTGISMTDVEHKLIEERHGIRIRMAPPELVIRYGDSSACEALDEDHRCRIHDDPESYPTVCKAFGAIEHMPCGYGCAPEAGFMSIEDYKLLDADINEVGGSRFVTAMDIRRLRQQLSTRTGVRRFREVVWAAMGGPLQWWKKYVEKHPEGE